MNQGSLFLSGPCARRAASAFGKRERRLRLRSGQHLFARHQPPRHIARDRLNDRLHVERLRQHPPPVRRVEQEPVGALVARHRHMRHHVDPEARLGPRPHPPVEQVEMLARHPLEHRIDRLVQHCKSRGFGVAQFDNDGGTLRRLDTRRTHRISQWLLGLLVHVLPSGGTA
jgi:hypothetical protein